MVPSSPYQKGKADAGERIAAAYAEREGGSVESGEGRGSPLGSSDAMVYRVGVEKPRSKKGMTPRLAKKMQRPHRQEAEAALAASPSGLSREARLRQIARVMPKLTGGLKGGVFSRTGREGEELVVPKYARANIRVTGERYADEPEGKFRPSKVRGMRRSWRPFMGVSAVRGVPLSGERRMAAIAAKAPDTNPNDTVPVYKTRNAG